MAIIRLDAQIQATARRLSKDWPSSSTDMLVDLAWSHFTTGNIARARDLGDEILAQVETTDYVPGVSEAVHRLGKLYSDIGQHEKAEDCLNKASFLEGRMSCIDPPRTLHAASIHTDLATGYAMTGMHTPEKEHWQASISIAQEIMKLESARDPVVYRKAEEHLGTALGSLGGLYSELDEPEKAIELLEQGAEICAKLDDRIKECHHLLNLAICYETLWSSESHPQLVPPSLVFEKERACAALRFLSSGVQYPHATLSTIRAREVGEERRW